MGRKFSGKMNTIGEKYDIFSLGKFEIIDLK